MKKNRLLKEDASDGTKWRVVAIRNPANLVDEKELRLKEK